MLHQFHINLYFTLGSKSKPSWWHTAHVAFVFIIIARNIKFQVTFGLQWFLDTQSGQTLANLWHRWVSMFLCYQMICNSNKDGQERRYTTLTSAEDIKWVLGSTPQFTPLSPFLFCTLIQFFRGQWRLPCSHHLSCLSLIALHAQWQMPSSHYVKRNVSHRFSLCGNELLQTLHFSP